METIKTVTHKVSLENPISILVDFQKKLKTVAGHLASLAEAFRPIEMMYVLEDDNANRIDDDKVRQLKESEQPKKLMEIAEFLKSGEKFELLSFPFTRFQQIKWEYKEYKEHKWKKYGIMEMPIKKAIFKEQSIEISEDKKNELLADLLTINESYKKESPDLVNSYWDRQIEFYKNGASVSRFFSEQPRGSILHSCQIDLNWHFFTFKALCFCKPIIAASIITDLMSKSEGFTFNEGFTWKFCCKIIMTVWVGRDITILRQGAEGFKRYLLPEIELHIEDFASICWKHYAKHWGYNEELVLSKKHLPETKLNSGSSSSSSSSLSSSQSAPMGVDSGSNSSSSSSSSSPAKVLFFSSQNLEKQKKKRKKKKKEIALKIL